MNLCQTIRRTAMAVGLAFGVIGMQAPAQAAIEEIDRIVAIVNDDIITILELRAEIGNVARELRQNGARSLPPIEAFSKQVLERLILQRIQLQEAQRTGLMPDDEILNASLRRIAESNNMSLSQFRNALQADGLSFSSFRKQVRDKIALTRLRQREVDNRIQVSDQDVENFLRFEGKQQAESGQEYRLGHILISLPEAASPEQIQQAKTRAAEVMQRLENGDDFSELAVTYSNGRQALQGGDLGWRKLGQIPSLFVQAIQDMEQGDTNKQPIRNPAGFHIIKLMETRGAGRQFVTQTKVRHILIRTNDLISDTDAQTRLSQLRERLQGGEPFDALARAHSDDKGSAIKGGDLGWSNPGTMVPAFEEKMNKASEGDITEPFQSQFGWHILEVTGRRQYDSTEDFLRTKAVDQIRKRRVEEQTTLWLRRLRDEAYVEYRLEEQ